MSSEITKKSLTPMQDLFLDALFNEAEGDFPTALRMAGYKTNSTAYIIETLKDEIISRAKGLLALNSPKAAMALINTIDNPTNPGAILRLKAAEQILDRVNIAKSSGESITISNTGGIFFLPAKEVATAATQQMTVIDNDPSAILLPP